MGTKLNPIYVNTLTDDINLAGSLRYAVKQVNDGVYDSIIIDPTLAGSTLELLSSLNFNADTSVTGTNLTITGKAITLRKSIEFSGLHFDFSNLHQGLFLLNSDLTLLLDSSLLLEDEYEGSSYGIRLNNNLAALSVQLTDKAAMSVANTGTGNAYGFYTNSANATLTFGDICNALTVSSAGTSYGVSTAFQGSGTNVQTISGGNFSGDWTVTGGTAYGFYTDSNDQSSISLTGFSGTLRVTSTADAAYGFYSSGSGKSTVTLGSISGNWEVNGAKNAFGMCSYAPRSPGYITIGNIEGNITVTANSGSATGFSSLLDYFNKSSCSMTTGDITGNITVIALNGSATGFYAHSSWGAPITTGNITGNITVTAQGGSAEGISSFAYDGPTTVTIGDVMGYITVTAQSGSAVGITSSSSGGPSTVTIGDVAGYITVTADSGSAVGISCLYGYYTHILTIGDVTGNITVTATGGEAVGIRAKTSITLKSLSGCMTVSSSTHKAVGLSAGSILQTDSNALSLTGTLLADGKATDSHAIEVSNGINLAVSGIVGAGYFQTTTSEKGMSVLVNGLKNGDKEITGRAVTGAEGYTAISCGSGNDTLTLNSGALVLGGVALGSGTNTVNLSTGARMYGNITADSATINFTTDTLTDHTVLTVTESGVLESANLTIHTGNSAAAGSYVLIGGLSEGSLSSSFFTVDIDGTEELVFTGENVVSGGRRYAIDQRGSSLSLTITESSFTDTEAPDQVTGVAMKDGLLVWDTAADNVGTVTYEILCNGTSTFTSDTFLAIDSMTSGSSEYKIRAMDAAGNKGEWSEVRSLQIIDGAHYTASVAFNGKDTIIRNCTTDKMLFGGNLCHAGEEDQTGSYTLDIQGGSFANSIAGGDATAESINLVREGDLHTIISSGTFTKRVAGGMYYGGSNTAGSVTQTGNVDLQISGGTFQQRIIAGANAKRDDLGAQTVITGNVSTLINAVNEINIQENLIAGSRGAGVIGGNIEVTFSGNGSKLIFGDDSVIYGGSNSDYVKITEQGKAFSSSVSGSRDLVFSAFTGDFGAEIRMFNTAAFKDDSEVSFTDSKLDLWAIEEWNFEFGSSISGLAANDFDKDTLNFDLTGYDGKDWTVLSGTENAVKNFASITAVNFGTSAAEYQSGCWTDGTYQLALNSEQNGMVLSTIA